MPDAPVSDALVTDDRRPTGPRPGPANVRDTSGIEPPYDPRSPVVFNEERHALASPGPAEPRASPAGATAGRPGARARRAGRLLPWGFRARPPLAHRARRAQERTHYARRASPRGGLGRGRA